MSEYAGQGDARRSMELLWGRHEPAGRGPKQGLSVEEIVAAAIALADAEGIGALSMRKVAAAVGRSAMALYTYVPSKHELVDLMRDRVLGELPADLLPSEGWRPAAQGFAQATWELYERHPWVLQLGASRPALGPNEMAVYETQLRLFDGLGLSALDMTRAVGLLDSYVRGAAKAVADARAAEHVTGKSDDDWWLERAPLLDELSGDVWSSRFPVSSRMAEEQAFDQLDRDPEDPTPYLVWSELDIFQFGLQRVLDGLEAYIASTAPRRRPGPPAV